QNFSLCLDYFRARSCLPALKSVRRLAALRQIVLHGGLYPSPVFQSPAYLTFPLRFQPQAKSPHPVAARQTFLCVFLFREKRKAHLCGRRPPPDLRSRRLGIALRLFLSSFPS